MGSWIVLFFAVAMAVMVNTLQTETRERRAALEVEGVVDTLVNIVHGQHRHYLYANPTGDAEFISSGLSGALDWLDDKDCGGASCYDVYVESGWDRRVKVIYQARSPAIAARIALHFGDAACVGNGRGICMGRAGNLHTGNRVILDLQPLEEMPLLTHFMPRSSPQMEDGGLFYMNSSPRGNSGNRGLYVDEGEVLNVPKALNLGVTASANWVSRSALAAHQDHVEPLWGDRVPEPLSTPPSTREPNINFGGDYDYTEDGVLIVSAPGNRDEVRYTRVAAGKAAIVLQAGPHGPGDPGHRAVFSAGPWDVDDSGAQNNLGQRNHVIDKDANLRVDEVISAQDRDLVVHVGEVEGQP